MRSKLIPPLLGYYTMAGGAPAGPVTVDATCSADTRILSISSNNNYGAASSLLIDSNAISKALLRFDLSSIPAGATCTAATLKLVSNAGESEATWNLYKITDANGDWIEGIGTSTAIAGEPTWASKVADGSGGTTTAWAGSAGLETAGTDYVDTIIATVTAAVEAAATLELPFNEAGLAVLADWFGDASNNGFLLVTTSTSSLTFYSKENGTESYNPILTITYTA